MSELFIMKTHEELKQIKAECQALAAKLKELSDDELKEVTGGLQDASIRIRGAAALNAQSPLYIIDGAGENDKNPQAGIPGLENIGPYAMVGGIPLDSDSKLKS